MGKRVNYELIGHEGNIGIVLYANNSHGDVDPDRLFVDAMRVPQVTINEMVLNLLAAKYPSKQGNHHEGQSIFSVDLWADDREYVLRAAISATFQGIPTHEATFSRDNLDGSVDLIDPETLEPIGEAQLAV